MCCKTCLNHLLASLCIYCVLFCALLFLLLRVNSFNFSIRRISCRLYFFLLLLLTLHFLSLCFGLDGDDSITLVFFFILKKVDGDGLYVMVLHSLYFFHFTFCLPNFASSSFFTPTLFFLFSLLLVIISRRCKFLCWFSFRSGS